MAQVRFLNYKMFPYCSVVCAILRKVARSAITGAPCHFVLITRVSRSGVSRAQVEGGLFIAQLLPARPSVASTADLHRRHSQSVSRSHCHQFWNLKLKPKRSTVNFREGNLNPAWELGWCAVFLSFDSFESSRRVFSLTTTSHRVSRVTSHDS